MNEQSHHESPLAMVARPLRAQTRGNTMPGMGKFFGRFGAALLMIFGFLVVPMGSDAARADVVAIESYGTKRPDDVDKLLGPVFAELQTRGFAVGSDLVTRVEQRISRQARVLDWDNINEAKRFIKRGKTQFQQGSFGKATKNLKRGLAILDGAPATIAKRTELATDRFNALVYLALSHMRTRNRSEATRTMAELVRSFRDKDVSRATYGPDARKLFVSVQRDLRQQGVGTLKVSVDDQRTSVFVNESYKGGGNVTVGNLPPGNYRVYVQQGQLTGRLHLVNVEAGGETTVRIAWNSDNVLETADGTTWMSFDSEAARAKLEAAESLRLARGVGASGIVLLGVRKSKGARVIVGLYLSVESTKPVRTGFLSIDPVAPTEAKLRELGRFLAGDVSLKGNFTPPEGADGQTGTAVTAPSRLTHKASNTDGDPSKYKTWKWVTLGGSVAAIATGSVLIAIHKPAVINGIRQNDARNTRPAGIATVAVGGALAAASVYFWIKDAGSASPESARSAALVPMRGGAMMTLSGHF